MLKRVVFVFGLVLGSLAAHAQAADSVYSEYLNFNMARFENDQDKVLALGQDILPNADELPEKARISFYFYAGKMFEDNNQPDRALPLYEKVAAAVPDYYVVHRALGYIWFNKSKIIEAKMDSAAGNKTLHDSLYSAYVILVKRALPHLEKAQACDPSDGTLAIIKSLYQKINAPADLTTLDERLRQLKTHCIDILSDN